MTFAELGIKRHIMAYMVAIAIVIYGIISYFSIGIDEYPEVDFPFIIVNVVQSGSDAKTIDDTITTVLLERLNGIAGIENITGTSNAGVASIAIQFLLEKDVDVAFNEVQAKVNEALVDLPTGIETPQIIKASNSDDPFLEMAISGNRTMQQLTLYAEEIIKKRLETTSGVSEVTLRGNRDREIKIELDVRKIANYKIGINEIADAFNRAHIQLPGGVIVSAKKELRLNLDLEYHSVAEIANLIVRNDNGSIIRLSDVARVIDSTEDFRTYAAYNSKEAINLSITKIVGYNAFAIEQELIYKLNNDIIPNLEPGITVSVTSNTIDYIRASVAALEEHLVLGTFLTAAVVYVFLRSFISTAIVSVAIPVSLLGSVVIMYLFNYTFNNITLLGLLLLIGVVVDDAIIVLENIYKKIEAGMDPIKASIAGSNQIVFAVLAATLSLVAIFGPMILMPGIVGKFFKSFAVVVTCGVLISYFVAIYIIPMLCSRFLRKKDIHKTNIVDNFFKKSFDAMEAQYLKLLKVALNFKIVTLVLAVIVFLSSFIFFSKVAVEFIPEGDESQFKVLIQTPTGSNIYYTMSKVAEIEERLRNFKEVKEFVSTIGGGRSVSVNRASINVNMVPIKDRSISQGDFINKLQVELANIAGAAVIVSSGSDVGGSSYKMSFRIVGPNLDDLYAYSLQLKEQYAADPRIQNVNLAMELLPQVKFNIDRDKASLMGVDARDIASAISYSIGGGDIGKFNSEGGISNKRYDVRIQANQDQFVGVDNLKDIYLRTNTGEIVRLDSVVSYEEYLGFSSIEKSASLYSATFNTNPPVPLGEAMDAVREITEATVPRTYKIETTGSARELTKTIKSVMFVFSMAIVMLYMVLASQFNSAKQPLILMTTVPLAIVGGVFGLFIMGNSLNLFSMIGLILLVGLVTKNSILLIDFTNEIRAKGKTVKEALIEACPMRLRPIFMTSFTIIFTMLPAVFATGAGSANNASLSVVVVGGVLSSTLLTLVVIPALYLVVEEFAEKRKIRKNQKINLT